MAPPLAARRSKTKGPSAGDVAAKVEAGESSLHSRVQRAARPRPRRGSDDEELWNYVWSVVEGGKQESISPEPPVKRRRVSSQQPEECTAIQVYRRRLTGKQPEPQLPRGRGSKGHYDVLGVPRDASAPQITAAYKRRVLETHPDKGGVPEDFRRVVAAFEELIDPRRRAAYDRALRMFGCGDGHSSGAEVAQDLAAPDFSLGRAAVFLARFRAAPCPTPLAEMPLPLLEALEVLLRGDVEEKLHRGAAPPSAGGVCRVEQHRGGYRALLAWEGLQISTQSTTCLSKAIDWQIALQRLHSSAQARCGAGRAPQVSSEDLWRAIEAAPRMELSFQASISKPRKVSTPPVQDLRLTLGFLQRLQEAKGSAPVKALQKLKLQLAKEAQQSKRRTQAAERRLRQDLAKELRRRRAEGAGRPTPSTRQALDASASPALPETRLVLWRLRGKTPAEFCAWGDLP